MSSKERILISCFAAVLAAGFWAPAAAPAKDEKLRPEDLIARHLDAIAPAEKRMSVKSRTTAGPVQVVFRVGGNGTLNGKGNIVSQGNSVRAGFAFGSLDYPGEQIAFDGSKVTAGQMSPGNYSPLAGFVYTHDVLLKDGLLFGSLSTGWALLDVNSKKPKLQLSGPKKIDGRELYELRYTPRDSKSGVQGWLYFEPSTFHHVRSVFKVEVPFNSSDKITDSAELIRYQIVETFNDFQAVDGFTLPHSYDVEFTVDSPRGGLVTTWSHKIETIRHNEPAEAALFSVR